MKKPAITQDKQARKEMPLARGVLDYFPLALMEVARVSFKANQQHNPGEPMHWARDKSTDHADCIGRHLLERGTIDDDGLRHAAKLAWRALALLETELELAQGYDAEAAARVARNPPPGVPVYLDSSSHIRQQLALDLHESKQ